MNIGQTVRQIRDDNRLIRGIVIADEYPYVKILTKHGIAWAEPDSLVNEPVPCPVCGAERNEDTQVD